MLSLSFRLARAVIEVTGDIADGDGLVLAEQPVQTIDLATDTVTLRDSILATEDAFERFIDDHRVHLNDRLGGRTATAT